MSSRRSFIVTSLAALAASELVRAQNFPSQPVHMVVPFPPGGGTDALARAIQEPMQKALGGTIVIDNKGGGGGSIAPRVRGQANRPTAHWLVVGANNLPLYPYIVAKLGFDAKTAFAPIGFIAKQELVLVGSADAPWADLKALMAARQGDAGRRCSTAPPASPRRCTCRPSAGRC